jgi:5-formyltetrahydrofolate cyclo-ligase
MKIALRKIARIRRADFGRACPDFARIIAACDLALPRGAVVAGYSPIASEADPTALMETLAAKGHVLALPRIAAAEASLEFRRWQDSDVLEPGAFGILEPPMSAEPVMPSVLLVPLLAFDADGYRLGYGGGFYDRTLADLRARGEVLAIGIAFSGQEVDALPHDDHDQRLDAVVTERGMRRME